jgi:putative ABC transport system permease protein
MPVLEDVRHAVRLLRKSPGFTSVALAALALGIGANSAMFSVVNAVLIRPLPYPDAERIGIIWQKSAGQGWNRINPSGPDSVDMREQATTLEQVAVLEVGTGTINGFGEPQQVAGMRVSTNLFTLLGIKPMLGRDFQEGEGFKDHVLIISHDSYHKWFGGDPAVIGRRLLVDGLSYTIIGVLPAGAWLPLPAAAFVPWSQADLRGQNRMAHRFAVLAKLKPGVTWEQASSELDAIQRNIAAITPRMKDWSAYIVPFQGWMSQRARPALLLMLAAVGLVLLIACTNLANLMLARAAGRERDVAVRLALGASRWALMRQLLTESVVLSVAGGALGLLLAFWGVDALDNLVPKAIKMPDSNSEFIRPAILIDGTVLAFTAAAALACGLLFGLAPALAASSGKVNNVLRQGQRGSTSAQARAIRHGLVVSEIALALVLLVAAAMTMQSFWSMQKVQPGFSSDHLLTMGTELPTDSRYRTDAEQFRFHQRVLENLARLPGIEGVGVTSSLPMGNDENRTDFQIEGRPLPDSGQLLSANYSIVNGGYFTAMRIPLKSGRAIADSDTVERPLVAVVDSVAVQRYFSDGIDPIGQKLKIGTRVFEIVGVVGGVRSSGLGKEPQPTIYVSYLQRPDARMDYVIRHPTPRGIVNAAKSAVYAVDSSQPVYQVQTMEEVLEGSQSGSKLMLVLLGVFAGIALLLASLGIYGVVSYAVTQRTSEIGIRIALGAGVGDVMRLVLGQGARLTAAGLALGFLASIAASRLLASLLFGVEPMDALVFATTAVILSAVALAATFLPARRAARTNPVVSLRYE